MSILNRVSDIGQWRTVSFERADILLLFIVGCVIVIVETVFCYITIGRVESRRGMVYGPFSQVYGFGAVLMTLTLAPLAERSAAALFFGSAALGGFFETICSIVQEKMYGTVSWDYSGERFSLCGGRTSLKFMLGRYGHGVYRSRAPGAFQAV